MTTPQLDLLVRRARRRMRVNRAMAVGARALVVAAVAALGWVIVGRIVVLPDVELLVVAGLAVLVVLAAAVAAAVRIRPVWAAWAADRWLQTKDRFSTAVEVAAAAAGTAGDSVAARQLAGAELSAAGIRRFPTGPNIPVRLLALGAGIGVLALLIGLLPNPQDAVREQLAAQRAAVEAQAEALTEEADRLEAELPTPERAEAARELRELAEELRGGSLEEALERLAQRRGELARRLEQNASAQRTALSGLAQELAARPLGEGETVRRQLDDLAERLATNELNAAQRQALQQRLDDLAAGLAAGAPEVSKALADGAAAAARGDQSAASGAVADAAAAVGDALAEADAQAALSQADAALASAEAGLRGAQARGQDAQAQGQGQGLNPLYLAGIAF